MMTISLESCTRNEVFLELLDETIEQETKDITLINGMKHIRNTIEQSRNCGGAAVYAAMRERDNLTRKDKLKVLFDSKGEPSDNDRAKLWLRGMNEAIRIICEYEFSRQEDNNRYLASQIVSLNAKLNKISVTK